MALGLQVFSSGTGGLGSKAPHLQNYRLEQGPVRLVQERRHRPTKATASRNLTPQDKTTA